MDKRIKEDNTDNPAQPGFSDPGAGLKYCSYHEKSHPLKAFSNPTDSWCGRAKKFYLKRRYEKNKARHKRLTDKWRANHPDSMKASHVKDRLRRRYGRVEEENMTGEEWRIIKQRHNHTCANCGKRESQSDPTSLLTVDHIIPLSAGGSNGWWNIQPLCLSCNSSLQDKKSV
jgi:5-methylcytosine-specific restriction endonuclease McrA